MYFYHGYTLGVASTIPGQEFTEADCALSVRGGSTFSDSKFSKYGIEFAAHSEISGASADRNGLHVWATTASVDITNLNILGRVKAASIRARLYSEFRAGDYAPSTVIAGSGFEKLEIDGKLMDITTSNELSEHYSNYDSMEADFVNSFTKERVLSYMVGSDVPRDPTAAKDLQAAWAAFEEQKGSASLKENVICSFVTKVSGGGLKTWGPIIVVPGFGNIYLGEVIVWRWMRCLNVFRIELDAKDPELKGGSICAGSAGANGTDWPPGAHPGNG